MGGTEQEVKEMDAMIDLVLGHDYMYSVNRHYKDVCL
jgi:hypothetical protein